MKKIRSVLTALLLLTGLAAMAQQAKMDMPTTPPKVMAVVNKAEWCPVCKANGQRAGMVLMSFMQSGLGITMNDLTDKKTTAASKKMLAKQGYYDAIAGEKATGVVTFVDAKTKKAIKQISLSLPDDQLKSEIAEILKAKS